DPAIGRAVALGAVAAAANGEIQACLAGELDDRPDVVDVRHAHDHGGMAIDVAGGDLARGFVVLVLRAGDAAVEPAAEGVDVNAGVGEARAGNGHERPPSGEGLIVAEMAESGPRAR